MSPRRTRSPAAPADGGKRESGKHQVAPQDPQLSFEQRYATASSPTADAGKAVPPAAETVSVLGVAEIVRKARQILESRFDDVRVEGEVSGSKRSSNNHLYFTLKDAEAQLDCVMYAREARSLRFCLADGQLVRCRGKLTIYEGRGRFQLQVSTIEPAGAGALAAAFEALKRKLLDEGLFASERKRPLPFLPRRIGVVTSRQGAVLRDIVRVAHRRFPVPILLAPTAVQGEGAAASIAAALLSLCRVPDVDVIILARGGGSMEDLWAFNDEALARTIAACPVPTISAVGHETDFTIADFVADVRAPTPSAAAELVVPIAAELLAEVRVLAGRLGRALLGRASAERLVIERLSARLGDPRRLIDERRQSLDDLVERAGRALDGTVVRCRRDLQATESRLLRAHPRHRIAEQRIALGLLERRLGQAGTLLVGHRRRAFDALATKLDALSPHKMLERGYSLTRGPDGSVLSSRRGLSPGDQVTVTLRDGDLRTRIEAILARDRTDS
ncbi:MAG: exodeoxyribonuclease VII large subunit [Deltaproteobacteria bacterium]|nr:exodeoxyribonuclease VII large subunit [Deltaproteobacteria bacterium]